MKLKIYPFLLLAYGLIAVITPNIGALDSNGPKFLSLAVLNLLAWLFLISRRDFKQNRALQGDFFRNRVGFVFSLFLLVALLSFINAINLSESLIQWLKLFTLFSATFVVCYLLREDYRNIRILAIALTLLLAFDSLTVFYYLVRFFAEGKPWDPYQVISIYSNRNILTAAIFIKLPFALWLFSFEKRWWKILGFTGILLAMFAILPMRSRTVYIGLVVVAISFVTFMGIRYFRGKQRTRLIVLFSIVAIVILIMVLLLTGKLNFILPEKYQDVFSGKIIIERLKTITEETPLGYADREAGYGGRTAGWKRSWWLIKEHPVLGVGAGNWKVEVLKFENLTTPDYMYMYKAHNDFIETAAETGIIGGLLFLSIFLLIWYNFLRAFFRRGATEESYKYLFLPAFGLFVYFFDAFFNFPMDRPEIGSLFAIYVGAGIAFSSAGSRQLAVGSNKSSDFRLPSSVVFRRLSSVFRRLSSVVPRPSSRVLRLTSYILPLTLLLFTIYIFYLNYQSLHLQWLIRGDLVRNTKSYPAWYFLREFPSIPNINIQGEPIAVQKARYLFPEGKYRETIELLKSDHSSPYDTRPEYLIALSYSIIGPLDSALLYYRKVFNQKPLFYNSLRMAVALDSGRYVQAIRALDPVEKDTALQRPPEYAEANQPTRAFDTVYLSAVNEYQKKNFRRAEQLFTLLITNNPNLIEAYDMRAYCYNSLKEYQKSNDDIEKVFAAGVKKPNLINMRGMNYHMLGNLEAACRDYKAAMEMGDKDAERNYELFCKKEK